MLLLACAVATVRIIEAHENETIARGHDVARMTDVAVVHKAVAGHGAQQEAIDVGGRSREVGAAALEGALRTQAKVER